QSGHRIPRESDGLESLRSEGGQRRDREEPGPWQRASGRADHLRSAARVNGDVLDAQGRDAPGSALHRLRDVVELQIEEDRGAELAHRLDCRAAVGDEELQTDLEQADVSREPGGEPFRGAEMGNVE